MNKYLEKITLSDMAFFFLLAIYFIAPESAVFSLIGHAFTALFSVIVIFSDSKNFKFPVLCGVYILFAVLCFTSVIYSIAPDKSMNKTTTVAIFTLLFLVCTNYFSHKENTIKFEFVFITISVLSCVYLAFQGNIFSGEAIGDAISNKNQVGVRLAIAFIVGLYSTFRNFKWWKLAILGTFMICIFLTGSRSSLVVFVIAAIVLIMLGFSSKDQPVGLATILILAGVMIVMYLIFNVPLLYNVLGYRLEGFFDLFANGTGDSSTEKRMELVEAGLEQIAENPLFGQGLNTFSSISNSIVGFLAYTHNNYIELLTGLGILGAVTYYTIPVSLTICSVVLSKQEKETKLLGSFMFSIMVAYFVSDIFTVNYYQKSFLIVFGFIYGTYIAYHRQVKPEVRVKL